MSGATRKQNRRDAPSDAESAAPSNTRVDAPHVVGAEATVANPAAPAADIGVEIAVEIGDGPPLASPGAGHAPLESQQAAVAIVQQVRAQAAQLADHLRRQQSSLDHREAELNARAGAMESQLRSARLWLDDQQKSLDEQRAALDRREKHLKGGAADLSKQQDGSRQMRDEMEQELRRREAAVEAREAAVAVKKNELAASGEDKAALARLHKQMQQREEAFAQQEAELRRARAEAARLAATAAASIRPADLDRRLQRLEESESLLAAEQADLKQACEHFNEEQAAARDELGIERQRLVDERFEFLQSMEKKKEALRRRRDDLANRGKAVRQLRAEVARAQSETLEMRLATEELWARLCGASAPAALAQSLGQLRMKLADQMRVAQAELNERRAEQQALAARLAEQHVKLVRRRTEFQNWMSSRAGELDEQAQALAGRQEDIESHEMAMKRLVIEHNEERRAYQQEVRRLLRDLRRYEAAAA